MAYIVLSLFVILTLGCSEFQASQSFGKPQSASSLLPPLCLQKSLQPLAIYGQDNRREWHEIQGIAVEYWAQSTVALISNANLVSVGEDWLVHGPIYGEVQSLCKETPYYEQPQGAFCSGFLISEDRIITAGHCIINQASCDETRFVFGFARQTADQEGYPVAGSDVYKCKRILEQNTLDSDYAVIELDRPVSSRTPLNIRREGRAEVGDQLILIGHPGGLPSKIAAGGTIFSTGEEILAGVDAFAGNSGSVVINGKTGLVEGILVAGEPDFIFTNQCRKENLCQGGRCRGEAIVPIKKVSNWIPDLVYNSPSVSCPDN